MGLPCQITPSYVQLTQQWLQQSQDSQQQEEEAKGSKPIDQTYVLELLVHGLGYRMVEDRR